MKLVFILSVVSLFGWSLNQSNLTQAGSKSKSELIQNTASDELKASIARGKLIYNETCVACHLGNGEGVKGTFPPLAKADYLLKFPDKAISAVKFGLKEKIVVNGVTYTMAMANPGLDNEEIADVMNYVFHSWGNKSPIGIITPKKVESIKP
ncbi:MAG: cytochrome c [Pedobacter sp.]|nr:MAG: cytochrome c [Pedobacter sp.]